MFFTLEESTLIMSSSIIITPYLFSEATLQIILPIAYVSHIKLCIIELPLSSGFIFRPFSNVDVAIGLSHFAETMEKAIFKESLVFCLIWV